MTALKKFLFGISKGNVLLPSLEEYLRRESEQIAAGKRSSRDGVIDDANLTIACFRDRKAEYNHRGEDGDDKTAAYFHPSQIGRCARELWFSHKGAPSAQQPTGSELLRTHLIFEIGTYAHVMFQNLCERAGVLAEREVQVVDHKLGIVGHCDGRLDIPGEGQYVLEFKTINSRGAAKLTAAKPEHIMQATIYMALLKLPGAIIAYFNKDTAELREFRVPFDSVLWEKKIKPRIAAYHRNLKANMMPEREAPDGPNKMPCTYCAYHRTCYGTFEQAKFLKKIKAKPCAS